MVNAGRLLNTAIFTLQNPVKIGDVDLDSGLQQLVRNEDSYYFSKIGKQPYAAVPISKNAEVLSAVFSRAMFFPA